MEYSGKYYLCFGYKGCPDVDSKHITHTYFGECDALEVGRIIDVCDEYFRQNAFTGFRVNLDKEDFFDVDKSVRVLRPKYPQDNDERWLPELRERLMPFNKSSFKHEPYKPHTTSDEAMIIGVIDRICIASGDTIVKVYKEKL